MDEVHGSPPGWQEVLGRPSAPPTTDACRIITVLSRTLETAGHGWVERITSANSVVLLAPSPMVTIGMPLMTWPAGAGAEKIPARPPEVISCEVGPSDPK